MSERLHIADTDLTLYAMGALSASEMESARAHLAACARCKEELRQLDLALAAYAQTTQEVAPPAGARERFMARLNEPPKTAPAPRRQGAKPSKPSWTEKWFGSGRWSVALAGSLALLLLAVGADDMRKRAEIGPLLAEVQHGRLDSAQLSQLMELLTSTQAQRVALHETPSKTPPPEGRVVYSARSGKLLLTAQNLHPLPAGKTYELWILQPNGGKPLPAGLFAPDTSGNATIVLADEPANLAVAGFGVTIENAGGAEAPTPPIILSGQ